MNLYSLPDDVWFQVMVCLEPKDCFNLVLCCKKFEDLHKKVIQHNKSLSIAGCNLPADEFSKLTDQIHLDNIRKLDVSGCFWLPLERIFYVLYSMTELEELAVDNTGIELVHLFDILARNPNIRKLSLDVFSKKQTGSLMKFCQMFWNEEKASTLLQCFNRLQSLKMMWYNPHEMIFWTFLVRLLQWCTQCQDLEITWKKHSFSYIYQDERVLQYTEEVKRETKNIINYDLIWMKKLRSFTYIEDNSEATTYWSDGTRHSLFKRLFNALKPQLERLCVQVPNHSTKYGACIISTPEDYLQDRYDFSCFARQYHLHDLGMFSIFSNLQSFTGEFTNLPEWQLFTRRHQPLRDLNMFFIDTVHYDDQDLATVCLLPNVDKLEITDCENNSRLVAYIISSCSNMKELVIQSNVSAYPKYFRGDVAREIGRASQLTTLKLLELSVDYDTLPSLLQHCNQLEYLHLTTSNNDLEKVNVFITEIASLSLPANISKLSIEWQYGASNYPACKFDTGSEMESESLSFMLEAATKWINLKTLTLHKSSNYLELIDDSANLKQLVLHLVSQLEHLTCLNLVGQFRSEIIETVEEAVQDATRLSRPRFRFFMGSESEYLSMSTDVSFSSL